MKPTRDRKAMSKALAELRTNATLRREWIKAMIAWEFDDSTGWTSKQTNEFLDRLNRDHYDTMLDRIAEDVACAT